MPRPQRFARIRFVSLITKEQVQLWIEAYKTAPQKNVLEKLEAISDVFTCSIYAIALTLSIEK